MSLAKCLYLFLPSSSLVIRDFAKIKLEMLEDKFIKHFSTNILLICSLGAQLRPQNEEHSYYRAENVNKNFLIYIVGKFYSERAMKIINILT